MTKNDISSEELEQMNYNDIAHLILQKKGKMVKITDLFKEVCELLDLNEEEYQSHIADFFELLSTDKRFVMLDNGFWDLKIKHNKGMVIDEEEDEEEDIVLDEVEEEPDDYVDEDVKDDDVEEDDLADLVIIDDTDDENN